MKIAASTVRAGLGIALVWVACAAPRAVAAREMSPPGRLSDRGAGVPASMFGAYIERGQLLIFPFFEYARDRDREYNPAKLGFGLDREFRGRYRSSAGQLFVGYGLTDRLALEVEGACIGAELRKSPADPSTLPARIRQSGLTDLEGQVRLRLMDENGRRPEIFAFAEVTAPSQKRERLIGDEDWDLKPGVGVVKGYRWGTVTLRSSLEYTREDRSLNVGETAVEYLKRLSPSLRLHLAVEGGEGGAPDEWDFVPGLQWRVTDQVFLKFDNALGLSSKATDWAPALGVLFAIGGST
jgi:hypothetical protein